MISISLRPLRLRDFALIHRPFNVTREHANLRLIGVEKPWQFFNASPGYGGPIFVEKPPEFFNTALFSMRRVAVVGLRANHSNTCLAAASQWILYTCTL